MLRFARPRHLGMEPGLSSRQDGVRGGRIIEEVSDRRSLQGHLGCGGGELSTSVSQSDALLPTPRVQGETPAPPALREKRFGKETLRGNTCRLCPFLKKLLAASH